MIITLLLDLFYFIQVDYVEVVHMCANAIHVVITSLGQGANLALEDDLKLALYMSLHLI
jgi:2-polyprenyl-6-methoxyphenol hydroxylase-like FAD-dependent oxidoreductase